MRRLHALLIAAGLAAAPAGVAAGPSPDACSPSGIFEKFEWSASKGRLGVMVMSLTPELRKHFGAAADRGVLVARVEPGTPAATAGIAVGDIIVAVRGDKIDAAHDVLSALAEVNKDQEVTIDLVRHGKPLSVQATLSDDPPARLFGPRWSNTPWLRELMKSFVEPEQTARPSDEPWLRAIPELWRPERPDPFSRPS